MRDTPYSAFNYLVKLGDGDETDASAGFSEISGLNAEVTVAEYRAGNAKVNYVTKIPAVHKSGDVTFKRGVIGANNLYEWLDKVRTGSYEELSEIKKDVEVKLKSENPTSQTAVVTWKLKGAIPIKWTGPTLSAKGGNEVAVEEVVMAVEHIEQTVA